MVQEDQRKSSARKTSLSNSPVVIRKVCCEERGLRTSQDLNLMDQYQQDTQPGKDIPTAQLMQEQEPDLWLPAERGGGL